MTPWEDLLFEPPVNWIFIYSSCMPSVFYAEVARRDAGVVRDLAQLDNLAVLQPESRDLWFEELLYARALRTGYCFEDSVCDVLGRILCQVLEVPRDCNRELQFYQNHNLLFFTNHRTTQFYCYHSISERVILRQLFFLDLSFQKRAKEGSLLPGQTYEKVTESAFRQARPYLAWECIFPDGIDMEALSPRDVNAHIRVKQQVQQKAKAPAPKLTGKEKDHPPPPPAEVREPPSSDRPHGAIYQTGRLLGRGGFAICYEGQLSGTTQKYALKIVKSRMPQRKMEQKFQTELQIHSKMKHANIVEFHRAFSYEKCTYIVLELCPNGSLMDMVKKRKFVTEPEVRFWTVQMAGAIKYMHAKGIIHRDLKMGNIFLDKDMNVKIGDFGLAALLMSDKDITACRRTTLCGTPNYIAPEILEKNKGGHDHAVDIWSLGIIIFAMLTGKPPFQSTTADEIYRRAREREYDWPKLDTSENFISQETKDLVASLLQGPEQRPDPDTIVQHAFFTCGWMPQSEEMTPELCESAPRPDQFLSVGVRAGRSNLYTKNLKKLCVKCEVGPWNPSSMRHTSAYKQVAAEEKAGLTPAVPLPEDVVYRRFDEWLKEEAEKSQKPGPDSDSRKEQFLEKLEPLPLTRPVEQIVPSSSKPTAQSFAAQQRARPQGSRVPSSGRNARSGQSENQAQQSSRATETGSRPLITIPNRQAKSRKLESRVAEKIADVENRLAADLADQLTKAEAERKSHDVATPVLNKQASIFNPRERLESVSGTKPDHILGGLRRLQTELERALNSRSLALATDAPSSSPTIVVKWVDYTNRFGLGYILNNGSVGCIFKEGPADETDPRKGYIPPSCVVVRDAERHLQNRGNEAYMDRHQIVPISGPNIEFYENRGELGMSRGKVNPQNYKVAVSRNGEAAKLSRGVDEWDDRKRTKICLWKKFANYMTAFGRDQDYPYDEALSRTSHDRKTEILPAGNVVIFYQRFGDVGCWAFCDGHFQFNFPDHTKIVLSADGTWCDFYHLPLEAARDLSEKGTIPSAALDDRQHLSYPLQTLLNFMINPRPGKSTVRKRPEIDPLIQGIPQANDFRRKVEFIRSVVKEWVTNGGLGNSAMDPKTRLRWSGYREMVNVKVPYKHVWVTIGARKGDDRRVAWFDPRAPEATVPDIE